MQFLILKFKGLMQAWGRDTFEDYRPIHHFPTRSGLTGLLACCLGIDREEKIKQKQLSESFCYAVSLDTPDIIRKIVDFQTVENVYKATGKLRDYPVILRKEYICQAEFTLALEFFPQANYSLEKVKQAVEFPIGTPRLGRRSCVPSSPIFERVIQAKDLLSALYVVTKNKSLIYSEQETSNSTLLRVRDVPTFSHTRQFITRNIYIINKQNDLKDLIDVPK